MITVSAAKAMIREMPMSDHPHTIGAWFAAAIIGDDFE
jgi:hypothetical protein